VKLFVVVRGDMAPGARAVGAVHAARQFAREHGPTEGRWFRESNTLALLQVEGEAGLSRLLEEAAFRGLEASGFREPDLGGQLTGVALGPAGARLVRRLPLALR